jgi:F0F1-type ATP synthase membrane subunit b/b'
LIKAEEEKQAALSKLTSVEAKLVGVDTEKAAILKAAREEVDAEKRRLSEQAASEAAKLKAQAESEAARLDAVARVQLRRFAVDESLRMAEEKLRAGVDVNTDARLVKSGIQAIGGLN